MEKLDKRRFFESLLSYMVEKGYLSESALGAVQIQLINLLTAQIEAFNQGMSSSIPEHKAKKLMEFIYYTIGFRLKQLKDIDESITLIEKCSIKELFEEGKCAIRESFEKLKDEYKLLQSQLLPTKNIAYRDTYDIGLAPFFKEYKVEFESQECPCSIDYPLSNDEMDEIGIDSMMSYIQKSLWEHSLCLKFNFEEIEALLKGYHEGYEHLLINIFELVLMNAIGRLMVGKDLTGLQLDEEDLEQIEALLEILPSKVLESKLQGYGAECLAMLDLTDVQMCDYAAKTITRFAFRIEEALEDNTLDKIFIVVAKDKEDIIQYTGGQKLDDEAFKVLVEEIKDCRSVQDKVKWIKEKVQNAEDLKDLLEADCLFDEEYVVVFDSLQDMELALVLNLTRVDEYGVLIVEDEESRADEKQWRRMLKYYLDGQAQGRRERITQMAERIRRN